MKKRIQPTFELAFESPSEALGFQLWMVSNLWQRRMKDILEPFELTHVQFLMLNTLARLNKDLDKPVSQMLVATESNCDKMMVSKVLRALEERKLIMRKAHHSDSRSKSILLTAKGMELLNNATPVFANAEEQFFKSLKGKQKGVEKRMRKLLKVNSAVNKEAEVSE